MIYPVILEATIEDLAAGAIRAPGDARGLQNRTDKTLRVEELRFRIFDEEKTDSREAIIPNAFASAEIQLRVGNEPITAGFVPLPAMTWPVGDFEAELGGFFGVIPLTLELIFSAFVTRFSKPFLLAPGERITVQAKHNAANNQRLVVTAICREAESGVKGFVPWLTFFKPPARVDGSGVFESVSTEADLVNPFDKEILIERFIGRIFAGDTDTNPETQPLEPDQYDTPAGQLGFAFDGIRVRIEDQAATQVVRDATPFGVVFDFIRKSWVVNVMLASKGFYRVAVESNFGTQFVSGTPVPIQPFIGMLGYRAVR